MKSDKKRVCNGASPCVLVLVPIFLARVQAMSICPNVYNATLEGPGTEPLAMLLCGFCLAQ